MKRIYSIYAVGFALVFAGAVLVTHPPTVAFAASCSARCKTGSDIHVDGDSCSCTDNVGCTWHDSDGDHSQNCGHDME